MLPAEVASGGSGKAKKAAFHAGQFIQDGDDVEFVAGQVIFTYEVMTTTDHITGN